MRLARAVSLLLGWALSAGIASSAEPAPMSAEDARLADSFATACDYGMAAAFEGQLARADSVFEQVLRQEPRHARALNGLGNVKALAEKPYEALAFYQRAESIDATDAGIVLNQATVYLLLGDTERARDRAGKAIDLAGGVPQAATLIGILRTGPLETETPKASETLTDEEQLEILLEAARRRVPADTLRARSGADSLTRINRKGSIIRTKKALRLRIAAARAGIPEAASRLYWKR